MRLIKCDRCGAHKSHYDAVPGLSEGNKGWSSLRNKDLCPACVKRALEKPGHHPATTHRYQGGHPERTCGDCGKGPDDPAHK